MKKPEERKIKELIQEYLKRTQYHKTRKRIYEQKEKTPSK